MDLLPQSVPHAQTSSNFLKYSVKRGSEWMEQVPHCVRAWIPPTLTSCHHQSAPPLAVSAFPHPLIRLHKRCRLCLYWSCNFRHVKLTLVVFFLSSGNSLPSPHAIQGLCGPYFMQPATNLKCLHITTGSKG